MNLVEAFKRIYTLLNKKERGDLLKLQPFVIASSLFEGLAVTSFAQFIILTNEVSSGKSFN